MFKVPEQFRVRTGKFKSDERCENNGLFSLTFIDRAKNVHLNCIASDGGEWEHVSVTCRNIERCPTWNEMDFIKDSFWGEDDLVIQYHPQKSENVSYHEYCLHLWRPIGQEIPRPPSIFVGPKKGGDNDK